jgi:hypothetical protein
MYTSTPAFYLIRYAKAASQNFLDDRVRSVQKLRVILAEMAKSTLQAMHVLTKWICAIIVANVYTPLYEGGMAIQSGVSSNRGRQQLY